MPQVSWAVRYLDKLQWIAVEDIGVVVYIRMEGTQVLYSTQVGSGDKYGRNREDMYQEDPDI